MNTLKEKYLKYRETQITLHSKILDSCVSPEDFNRSVEVLGVVENNQIVLENENEREVILDFNVYEKLKDGKSALDEFIEKNVEKGEREKEMLNAMIKSKHSLYEIMNVDKERNLIRLKDLLNGKDTIYLIDIGLSETINESAVIFTRLLHLGEFSMTTGLGYTFSANHKHYLMKRSRKSMKKVKSNDHSIQRFISFFKLNRTDGRPIMMERVDQK